MNNTTKLFDLTELAEASYAQFNLFGNVQDALKANKFSALPYFAE